MWSNLRALSAEILFAKSQDVLKRSRMNWAALGSDSGSAYSTWPWESLVSLGLSYKTCKMDMQEDLSLQHFRVFLLLPYKKSKAKN